MDLLFTVLTILVALEHLGIMVLEIWGQPERQAKVFGMPLRFVQQPHARIALANQGIYNGMLGLALLGNLWLLAGQPQHLAIALLLLFVVVVALFGSLTAKHEIFWLQGCPALVTLLVLLIFEL